jgi:hypothetical protein
MMLRRTVTVVLLHLLTAVGLIALLVRSTLSLRASSYYDPLFDVWSILFMGAGVALVLTFLVAAWVSWRKFGRARPLVAVDLFVSGWLLLTVISKIAAKGELTAARALPLAVAIAALLGAWSVVQASRGHRHADVPA